MEIKEYYKKRYEKYTIFYKVHRKNGKLGYKFTRICNSTSPSISVESGWLYTKELERSNEVEFYKTFEEVVNAINTYDL